MALDPRIRHLRRPPLRRMIGSAAAVVVAASCTAVPSTGWFAVAKRAARGKSMLSSARAHASAVRAEAKTARASQSLTM